MITSSVLLEVSAERGRQDANWGDQSGLSLERRLAILTEEVGEVAEAILLNDLLGIRLELIQVAAVAVALVEDLDLKRPTT